MSLRYKQAEAGQPPVATEEVAGAHFQLLKLVDPSPGSSDPIGTAANPMKVSGAMSVAEPVEVEGTVSLSVATLAALETITALVASFPSDYPDAAVLAKVEAVRALLAATLAVTGPLTDAQLRANPVPVSNSATPNLVGAWSYVAGTLTSGSLTGVGRCVGIRVYANGGDGSFNVNGGSAITVRSGAGVDIDLRAQVTAPVVNWVSGTLDVIIEGLT